MSDQKEPASARSRDSRGRLTARNRDGNAIAEFALVAPVLAVLLLGGIDVGQAINVAQVVNEASRHGARCASRAELNDVAEVEDAVESYISNAFPSLGSNNVSSAVTVNVMDGIGVLPNGDLSSIDSGGNVTVEVTVSYESFRWMIGFIGLNGSSISTSTRMRRE